MTDNAHVCPICLVAFEPTDLCATDITEGTCHYACLEGSPTVNLETGEPIDGPIPAFRYDELRRASPPQVAPANPAQVMDAMVAEAAKSLGHEGVYISYETIRRALTAAIGAGDEQPFHLVEEFDDVGAQMVVAPAMGVGGQAVAEDWRDDPSADERWNAGLDYGQTQLCAVLGVDPEAIDWDAATETLDGDVQAVIGKILTARFGEEWPSAFSQPHPADERVVEAKWPAYCAHPGSCSRHRQCMYYGCKHEGTSISEAVDAALAAKEGRKDV